MSTEENENLKKLIDQLLADPQYTGHPLRDALQQIHERQEKQRVRMDRVARISDGFQAMLHEQKEELKTAATHDMLTGIGNRALLTLRQAEASKQSLRTGTPYCLAILDTDNFKLVNDTWGHAAGDRVLISIAQALAAAIREDDYCGRWGGEEFLLLMPRLSLEKCTTVINRVQQAISDLAVSWDSAQIRVTASFGITEHKPGEDFLKTLERADAALIQAKQTGRARCIYRR